MKHSNSYDALAHILKQNGEKDCKRKLKVHPKDDRMMEDGTLNLDHWTLRSDRGMTDGEYNEHLRASDGGM